MGILIAILVCKKLFFAFIHCFSDSARILSFFPLVDHGCEISGNYQQIIWLIKK
jgi:hypothetical protein